MALRLESSKPERAAVAVLEETSAEEWRRRAVQTADRLKKAETKIQELSLSANELRARLTKEKSRLDEVSALADQRQVEIVSVAAERDELKTRIRPQDDVKRRVWEIAQGMKDDLDAKVGELLGAL
jgi:uncharacterized coiled-coil DUF342 family protein